MTQQDVLDYIRKTPHNSNVNVVKGMLDSLGGGGSSDNMAILPKLTVTLNIDNTEHADTYGLTDVVELNNGIITLATFNPPQTSQIWEGYVVPKAIITEPNVHRIDWEAGVTLVDESFTGYYNIAISNMVNCVIQPDLVGVVVITDPTKPASCTMNAVYTSY